MKNLGLVIIALMLTAQSAFSAAVYKENFAGGVFIYDGDQPYENALQIPSYNNSKLRQNNTDLIINTLAGGVIDKWKKNDAIALTYCISDKFGKNKEAVLKALDTATNDWMNAANVKYIYMPEQDARCDERNTNVVFDVRPIENQPYLARSFFPNFKRISRNILIDGSSFQYNQLAFTGFLRHELGHTLGFRHEHISKNAIGTCPEDENFKPLTSYDPFSVMHYPQCGGKNLISDLKITALDEEGAKTIYPF